MKTIVTTLSRWLTAGLLFLGGASSLPAAKLRTLYHFQDVLGQASLNPYGIGYGFDSSLVIGANGDFYALGYGGKYFGGSVVRISPNGSSGVVFSFGPSLGTDSAHVPDGYAPNSIVAGRDGNFYGTTTSGSGAAGNGTLFRLTPGGVLSTLHTFSATDTGKFDGSNVDGAWPSTALTEANDGKFYGLTAYGGQNRRGTLYRISSGGLFELLSSFPADFVSAYQFAGLTAAPSDSFLYGAIAFGGANGTGLIFKVDTRPAFGNAPLTIYSFEAGAANGNNTSGAYPNGALTRGVDGAFYGMTGFGGANGTGTVFRVRADGTVEPLHSFAAATGTGLERTNADGLSSYYGSPRLLAGTDQFLFGVTPYGGNHGTGTIFKIDSTNGALTTLYHFSALDSARENNDGAYPFSNLLLGTDGLLFGTTSQGGDGRVGTTFKIPPAGGPLTVIGRFATIFSPNFNRDGLVPANLLRNGAGELFGSTYGGGLGGTGTIFKLSATEAFSTEYTFAPTADVFGPNTDGTSPFLAAASSGTGYFGVTQRGGTHDNGTLFQYDAATKALATVHQFPALPDSDEPATADGADPIGQLISAGGGVYYGATKKGGSGRTGILFRFDASTSVVTPLYSFDALGSDEPETNVSGAEPEALAWGGDGYLYGAARKGGPGSTGTVFRFQVASKAFEVLHSFGFVASSPGSPREIDGPGFGSLNADGASPAQLLKGRDGNLYGTATYGGTEGAGIVYVIRFARGRSTFSLLHSFPKLKDPYKGTNSEGAGPFLLMQASDGNLYGSTHRGGGGDSGTIFRLTTKGTFKAIYHFTATAADNSNADGSFVTSLLEGSAGKLYGTTAYGGTRGFGTVFAVDPLLTEPSITVQPVGPVNFGKTAVLGTKSMPFTITNNGLANLTIVSLEVVGAERAVFQIGAFSPRTSLKPNASRTVAVSFTPKTNGLRSATLRIKTDDPQTPMFDVALSGATPAAAPALRLTPASRADFGTVGVNASKALTFTLANEGLGSLTGLATSVIGADAADFTVTRPVKTSLAFNASTTCKVTFKPKTGGARNAVLKIASNDLLAPTFIALTGSGLAPILAVEFDGDRLTSGEDQIALDPVLVDAKVPLVFILRNKGSANLTGLSAVIAGPNRTDFSGGVFGATTLARGARTTYTVTYSPKGPGPRSATLTFKSNDPLPDFTVDLHGTGHSFADEAGAYGGLFEDGSGVISIDLTSSGSFTGRLQIGSTSYTLAGSFNFSGGFSGQANPELPVSLFLTRDESGETPGAFYLSGDAGGASFTIYHAAHSASAPVEKPGVYTVLLFPSASEGPVPQGTGYATFKLDAAGSVDLTGKLADGTNFSAGGPLIAAADGTRQFFIYKDLPYPVKGRLSGVLTFDFAGVGECFADLQWSKPPQSTGDYYRDGFEALLSLSGVIYTRPASGRLALAFPDGVDNGRAVLIGGGLVENFGQIAKSVTLTRQHTVVVTPPNDENVAFTINASAGTFTGSFKHPESGGTILFGGVLFDYPGNPQAGGFFLGPVTDGVGESGSVTLAP